MRQFLLDADAISGILGSVSIACWVVVFSPQIIENFRRSSAEGLSIVFIVIWLVGDVFNILGAVLQGVLPTMTVLAVYYTLADIVLMLQCFYYRGFTLSDEAKKPAAPASPTERSALLAPPPSLGEHMGADAVRLSPATPMHAPRRDAAALQGRSPVQRRSIATAVLVNLAAVLVVCAAGVVGWYLSTQTERRGGHRGHERHAKHEREPEHEHEHVHFDVLGQVFGYVCAALYLGSRVPQLLLNFRRKSTEGISVLFFLFACVGNLTFVLSILVYAPECGRGGCAEGEFAALYLENFLVNLSWLIGSFGTLLLDGFVFVQFFIYRQKGDGEVDGRAVM